MDLASYEARLNRPVQDRVDELSKKDGPQHVIFADQFDRQTLEKLCQLAEKIRTLSRSEDGARALNDLLRHKRAMLYFTQPSTRTFLSFTAACQILGIACNEVRDPRLSSEVKGETPFDSIRMFGSYFDVVIMRSLTPKLAEACAYLMNDISPRVQRLTPIVNAGSGADEHPTQALLDIYTIDRHFKDVAKQSSPSETNASAKASIDHKTIGFCGDIGRGRTIRSLAQLLAKYDHVTMHFIAADEQALRLPPALKTKLIEAGATVYEHDSLDAIYQGSPVISALDVLYMTRIQTEHDQDNSAIESRRADTGMNRFKLTTKRVAAMKPTTAILHPFPRDSAHGEIPTSIDDDPRALYFLQARNGMWARAALLAQLFDVGDKIHQINL